MFKKTLILMTILVFGCVGLAFGQAGTIVYDGMVKNSVPTYFVTEDTGIFVTNANPVSLVPPLLDPLTGVTIEVFDQNGDPVITTNAAGTVPLHGPAVDGTIPPLGFGWITLGEVLRDNLTLAGAPAPIATDGRQKFSFRINIATGLPLQATAGVLTAFPVVEIKQVTYEKLSNPERIINNDHDFPFPTFKTCSEVALPTYAGQWVLPVIIVP